MHARLSTVARVLTLLAGVLWAAAPAAAQRVIDSGWIDVSPQDFKVDAIYDGVSFRNIDIWERVAIQSDDLAVITAVVDLRNETGLELFFDLDLLAVDATGETLFAFTLSPTLFGVGDQTEQRLKQTHYVMPGTLARVATYRWRYVGLFP